MMTIETDRQWDAMLPRLACRGGIGVTVLIWCALFAGSAMAWVLPEGRAYEMVTPPYKADYGAQSLGASPNGETVAFTSLGEFADSRADFFQNPYIARRDPLAGWITSSTNPPPAGERLPGFVGDYDSDLDKQVTQVSAQKDGIVNAGETAALILSDLARPVLSFTQAWPIPDRLTSFPAEPGKESEYVGASADLSHVVFASDFGGLYQIAGIGGPDPTEEAVAVVGKLDGPAGSVLAECPGASLKLIVTLGRGSHSISDDGSDIFFEHCGAPYVRINGSTTLELCPQGEFRGAAENGSKVLCTSNSGELEIYGIDSEPGHEAVTTTTPITPGVSANYVISSDDAARAYFTSPGVLTGANTLGKSPEAGGSNLYMYDSVSEKMAFIATATIDKGGESGEDYEAQTTPDGRFLVFTTRAQVTADDTDVAGDVYRYDAETGSLVRISVGEEGHDINGNNNVFNASIVAPRLGEERALNQWRLGSRAISGDGGTVVFSTAEPLSPQAVNGRTNVYAWHEGNVGMISTGQSQTADNSAFISPSGRDLFFNTSEGILPQDSDGLPDIYDARIAGGFPETPVSAGHCSGDSCQGSSSGPSLLAVPASATFSGFGNLPKPRSTLKSKHARPRCRRGYGRHKKRSCHRPKKRIGGRIHHE